MSSIPPSDIAYRVLRLEQQLESYQRLHAEELDQIRRAVEELKELVLTLNVNKPPVSPGEAEESNTYTMKS